MVGLGYIGLPTAAVMANAHLRVTGIDVNPQVVETINSGRIHLQENDLAELVEAVVANGLLKASLETAPADVFVIAVPTPFTDAHVPDVSYVLAAARSIAKVLKKGDLVILESTSPVGTTEQVVDVIGELRSDLQMPSVNGAEGDISVAYCPERVLPGRIIVELIENDRSIGGITPACAEKAAAFYRKFVKGECSTTSVRVAEMVKLSENAFRDLNIAFANELSLICDRLAIDTWEVIRLANRHPRVNILAPGPGVGGHCIAVDPWFIVDSAPEEARLIRTAREVNDSKPAYVIERIVGLAVAQPETKIAVLGLAFKANIDDFRESPALEVAKALHQRFVDRLMVVEPYAGEGQVEFQGIPLAHLDDALDNCGIIVVLVDHDAFCQVDPEKLAGKTIYDTRGIWPA